MEGKGKREKGKGKREEGKVEETEQVVSSQVQPQLRGYTEAQRHKTAGG